MQELPSNAKQEQTGAVGRCRRHPAGVGVACGAVRFHTVSARSGLSPHRAGPPGRAIALGSIGGALPHPKGRRKPAHLRRGPFALDRQSLQSLHQRQPQRQGPPSTPQACAQEEEILPTRPAIKAKSFCPQQSRPRLDQRLCLPISSLKCKSDRWSLSRSKAIPAVRSRRRSKVTNASTTRSSTCAAPWPRRLTPKPRAPQTQGKEQPNEIPG